MDKEVTIYDIAKGIGVSPTTVSRALNNHPAVKEKTKKKIFQAAAEMGYQSNVFAANLRSKKTNNIGVIVPSLNSSFQASVLAGMEKIANESGYNLVISQSLESADKEIANTRSMFKSRVDGLIVSLASEAEHLDHFSPFHKKGIPVLFYDRITNSENSTGVTIDNIQAAQVATNHMIDQGCRRIVHVLGSTKISVYADRLKGYKYALIDRGFQYEDELVIVLSEINELAAEQVVDQIMQMKPLPDGVFVSNDACAASCMNHLKQRGIRIPEDMSIVGFNNEVISRLVEPKITTINYPGFEMGEVAMRNLINHLDEPETAILHNTNRITLRSELLIRESSLKKK
ncbi:LacI family DNA-binding transcriptional regulator [Belliella kenyensis]|uniref:LacI family DNA-binding transcriptional regulator n=1 Tax=Belliella kenyensis TaxID=1472724 RepID=A0ABV8ERG4_9BACT|nr:LacI family DNA-binding transcriptional regulator [Belliella kenyensis]MCH7402015.1 LacI family transcriptional regulator [Belliella kenyensis]MDN3605179.1 LacI family DNA-binding transcriptional regulator [Belliella kenyensis]